MHRTILKRSELGTERGKLEEKETATYIWRSWNIPRRIRGEDEREWRVRGSWGRGAGVGWDGVWARLIKERVFVM